MLYLESRVWTMVTTRVPKSIIFMKISAREACHVISVRACYNVPCACVHLIPWNPVESHVLFRHISGSEMSSHASVILSEDFSAVVRSRYVSANGFLISLLNLCNGNKLIMKLSMLYKKHKSVASGCERYGSTAGSRLRPYARHGVTTMALLTLEWWGLE